MKTSFTTRTGFRTIVLIEEPYPDSEVQQRGITPGDQYHFEINGKAFYSSGTNIIPYDPFYARTTSEKVRWVIESAVLSGQNMVSSRRFYQSKSDRESVIAASLGWRHLPAIGRADGRVRFLLSVR